MYSESKKLHFSIAEYPIVPKEITPIIAIIG
jgi:hypothetical protein